MDAHAKKYLIVNADDFDLNPDVERDIIEAHEYSIMTSASLMVHWLAAVEATAYSREHPNLSLGLHIDLGEWGYRDETWLPLYEVVPAAGITAVVDEEASQLATFRDLVGKDPTLSSIGFLERFPMNPPEKPLEQVHVAFSPSACEAGPAKNLYLREDPTPLDSYQHAHLEKTVHSIVVEIAGKLAIPLRHCSPNIRYCGQFYGQTAEGSPLPGTISVDGLITILATLPAGLTELCAHPGYHVGLDTVYCSERVVEVCRLCDRRARAAGVAMGIELCSFGSMAVIMGELDERED